MQDGRRYRIAFDGNCGLTIIVFILTFFSNDTYLFGTNSNTFLVSFPRYILLAFCLYSLLILAIRDGLPIRLSYIWVEMIATFLIVSYLNEEHLNRTIIKILCITAGFLICCLFSFCDYAEAFCKVMNLVAISSIVFELIAYICPALLNLFPVMVNSTGVRFYTCFFSGLDSRTLGSLTIRAGGIFWEPGVYQIYLNLAILFELIFLKNKKKNRLIAYIIALVITFSTTGYIAFAWILASYLLFFDNKHNFSVQTKALYVGIIAIVSAATIFLFGDSLSTGVVFGKLFDSKSGTANVRYASVVTNIEVFLDYPLHGVGMERIADEFFTRTLKSPLIYGFTDQNTNTLLYQFAVHGGIWGSLFLVGTFKFGNIFSKKKIQSVCVFIVLVIMYIGENLQVSILPYVIIFYGYNWRNEIVFWGKYEDEL